MCSHHVLTVNSVTNQIRICPHARKCEPENQVVFIFRWCDEFKSACHQDLHGILQQDLAGDEVLAPVQGEVENLSSGGRI